MLELVRWETHVAPGIGRDAQDVVNRQIGDYDIFVGIMWKRFGTPTAVAGSGTDEEFQRAYARWQENPSLPIMSYFSQAPTSPKSKEEITQLAKSSSPGRSWPARALWSPSTQGPTSSPARSAGA